MKRLSVNEYRVYGAGEFGVYPLGSPFFIGCQCSIGCHLPISRHVPPPQSERVFIWVLWMSDGGMSYLQAYGHLPNLSSPPADTNVCVWPQGATGCDSTKPGGARCQKRRITANKKERRRTLSINNAFSELRNCIPQVPADTKLSKIKTLKLAIWYITYLNALLDDESKSPLSFNTEVESEPDHQSAVRFKTNSHK